jgi:nucleoside-diphosphate-sugar epimerase
MGTWVGGKEKAPAAMCRKAAEVDNMSKTPGQEKTTPEIEVWGDGQQTRSFLYVDECVEAVLRLMESDFIGPVNIGSEEMVTINELAQMAIDISQKEIKIKNLGGKDFLDKYGFNCPVGVRGRNSDNKLFKEKVNWEVSQPLRVGMEKTYEWISQQVEKKKSEMVYIYESPDGGKTVYRREFGKPHSEREIV